MSWLISLVVAGLMFTSESGLPAANHNLAESKTSVGKTDSAGTLNNSDETERFAQTFPLNANGSVSVSNVNGSITIDVWDRNEVKLEYVKTADTKENLAEAAVQIDAAPGAFRVETDYGDWSRRNSGARRNYGKLQVDYRLSVPRNAALNEITTVNGSVNVAGGGNLTKASSVNGQVRAVNLRGTANLSTVNGTVEADFDRLQTGSRISLNTVNGTINLVVPSDADATVRADTVNGNIVNDFGLPVRKGEYVGRDLYGRIGSGDVQIRLNSVNGTLSLKRRNDGKNVNPATNLLTTRNEDDGDGDDSEVNITAKPPRPPRAPRAPRAPRVPKPPRDSGIDNNELNKTIEQSIRDAEREVERLQPELEKAIKEGLREAAKIDSAEIRARLKEAAEQMSAVNWSAGVSSVEEKSDSFPVKGTPVVTIDAGDCQVSVRGWDKSEVSYSWVRIGRASQNKPRNIDSAVSVKAGDSDVSIKVSEETFTPGNVYSDSAAKMRIEVFVPRKSNLKVITDREIRLEGVSGDIDLQGAEESVNVRDAGGKLSAETTIGKIRVIGFKGEANARTDAGAMNLEGDFRGLSARTTTGVITLTLPENANVDIESNRKKDIVSDGVSLVYQGDGKSTSTWKIGGGGENHLLYTYADGRVIIRSHKRLQN